jgi:hypothetical protein
MDNNPVQRRRLPVALQVILLPLWALICGIMLLSAVIGLACIVLGMISFLVDLSGSWKCNLPASQSGRSRRRSSSWQLAPSP